MYQLKFWFEHGGGCLWSVNNTARERYGYKVNYTILPVSEPLKDKLAALEKDYHTILDWDDPAAGSKWSAEQTADFAKRAHLAYEALCSELGEGYTVLDELDPCT